MLERIHLATLLEVEKQGSLTAAAEVLHLTQSALSHSMKKLEQQLGTDIWLREGRTLRLTQAGQYLHAVAQRVKAVQCGKIAFPGHTKHMGDALGNQAFNKQMAGMPRHRLGHVD